MERLRFLHIPKTAGSTFTDILYRQYDKNNSFNFTGMFDQDLSRFNALSKFERDRLRLFIGHAPIATGIKEVDSALTITILRDPIERVKSFCQHVSEGKSPYLLDSFPPENFDLEKFLRSGNIELSNLQTKFLINKEGYQYLLPIVNMSESEARDVALDTLFNRIFKFGLQEYFDESLIMFSSSLNWRLTYYEKLNEKNNSKLLQFDKNHLKQIAELNAIDLEVYKIAKQRFRSELDKVPFKRAKLKWLHFRNDVHRFKKDSVSYLKSQVKRVIYR